MATADSIGYGLGDTYRRNKDRIKVAAINALVPTTALIDPAKQAATATTEFAGGVRRGVAGEQAASQATAPVAPAAAPEQPQIGFGLDRLPESSGNAAAEPPKSIVGAENVATQPAVVSETTAQQQPALGLRKVVDPAGNTAYTNNPEQPGGKPFGVRGNLSISGDPRTEGMSQAQAAAYWQNQSDQSDAKKRQEELQAQADANLVTPNDSIGTVQSKRANVQRIQRELTDVADQSRAASERGFGLVPKVQSQEEREVSDLNKEALQLGVRSKRAELQQQEQVDKLRQEYANETDPEKRRALASKINTLTGKDQPKYQVVAEKGVAADGITPTQTNYLLDDTGNVRPVAANTSQNQAQEQAHRDAQAALATGKISKEEINKRLVANGYQPI
jgi:hypothetical protein